MGILSNAISGLQASQTALRTTGHNISNANTEGFSRQRAEYGTRPAEVKGYGFVGSGVNTETIKRVVNEYITSQLRSDTTNSQELSKFDEQIGKIDSLLAGSGTGLSSGLQTFFSAMQTGADDPSSVPARQLIIAQAESLAARFNLLHGRLNSVETSIMSEVGVIVSDINSLAQSIGTLNTTIQQQMALSQGDPPNDLLDQRDEQLRKLSELISIQVIEQDKGSINVMIGSGQPLVVGQSVSQLGIEDGDRIIINNTINTVDVTDTISGGEIGGLLRFRSGLLSSTFNELGRVAIILADEFNQIQQQGLDLDGDFGSQIFTEINDARLMAQRVVASKDNAPPNDRDIFVEISDTSELTIEDYRLRLIPNTQNYIVTRQSDGSEVTQGILSGAYPTSIEFEGLTVHLNSGSFQGGDEYLLQPTRQGAVDIESALDRPEDIAFALPIRTLTGNGNIGNGVVSAGEILDVRDANGDFLPAFATPDELSPPIVIQFTSPTTYDVLDFTDQGNPQDFDPPLRNLPYVVGVENFVFNTDPGATMVTGDGLTMGLPPGRVATVAAIGGTALPNGYPVEQWRFTTTNPETGGTSVQDLTSSFNSSANTTAVLLSNLEGVTANAFTELVVTDTNIASLTAPIQIRMNGEDLIDYQLSSVAADVPDPATDEGEFYSYLAERINSNPALVSRGFFAQSSNNPITGNPELKVLAASGIDVDFRLEGLAGDNLSVNDGVNPNVRLTAVGVGSESKITIGGRIDVTLADNVVMTTAPTTSQFFGNSTASNFAESVYTGYQVSIKGTPSVDDRFIIEYNSEASLDNRNALRFVEMETREVIEGDSLSLAESYGHLVERVGTESNLAQINSEASLALLRETEATRNSISGVNLDEEAANLIRFEQVYNANARVITVARDLFDTLLNSV